MKVTFKGHLHSSERMDGWFNQPGGNLCRLLAESCGQQNKLVASDQKVNTTQRPTGGKMRSDGNCKVDIPPRRPGPSSSPLDDFWQLNRGESGESASGRINRERRTGMALGEEWGRCLIRECLC